MSNTFTYTVTLSEAENDAFRYAAHDVQSWIDNAVHNRARIAMDEILDKCFRLCLEHGVQVPQTKEEIITLAFERGWVIPLSDIPPSDAI